MQTHAETTNKIDLVLIGGGHSHLSVIRQLAMNPHYGLRVTVISKDIHTPYSGMLPGLIAGHYHTDEAHIDLRALCQSAGIRIFHSAVHRLDTEQQLIYCHDRPPVRYDFLSINAGSQPALDSIPGANTVGIAIKPVGDFLHHWQVMHQQLLNATNSFQLAVIGGGAASVEIALACQFRLRTALGDSADSRLRISLYCNNSSLLEGHNLRVQHRVTNLLAERGISVHLGYRVTLAEQLEEKKRLHFAEQPSIDCDDIIWTIHAGSPDWPQRSGLACDQSGFISVNQYLQSESHPTVFAAGDIVHFSPQPLAKNGVYAVRAGQQLSDNIHRAINHQPLKPFRPQRRFLSLLMTGDKQAIASRGAISFAGAWVWRWKDAIDRRFMARFQTAKTANVPDLQATPGRHNQSTSAAMRCGGCGAKVASTVLSRVMTTLQPYQNSDITLGLDAPDDAAVINPPAGKQWLQSVDYFRAFIDDPYVLGYIATNHCLSDIYAMGGTPHSAMAIATVPYAAEKLVEDTLLQLMRGAVDSLNKQQTALIGGHSSEGAELGFGLSVNGTIDQQQLLSKGGLVANQYLILSKPLGTGILLAANMQGQAQGRWIDAAIQEMLIDNRQTADILHRHQASACTDITGFGLLGHLLEMLRASQVGAELYLDKLPLLAGAVSCSSHGWLSSLYPDNLRAEQYLLNRQQFSQHANYPLLFDPQTAGGLLAAVPEQQFEACLQALHAADCRHAAVIGKVIQTDQNATVKLY